MQIRIAVNPRTYGSLTTSEHLSPDIELLLAYLYVLVNDYGIIINTVTVNNEVYEITDEDLQKCNIRLVDRVKMYITRTDIPCTSDRLYNIDTRVTKSTLTITIKDSDD